MTTTAIETRAAAILEALEALRPSADTIADTLTENERLEAPAFRHGEEKPLSFVSKIRTCYTPQYMV